MIVLFTDFGGNGPYVGQMQAVLYQWNPQAPVIDLLNDAPTCNPKLSSYLLAALCHSFPHDSVFLAVIDPGVGGSRRALVLSADGHYFVGPDNGLFNTVAVQSKQTQWQEIIWRPDFCSTSFHGRDLFAPVAACLANGTADDMLSATYAPDLQSWPADLQQIVYFDHYGNAITGIRYLDEYAGKQLLLDNHKISQADTFCTAAPGQPFWYQNSCGLVEIAVNQGRAKEQLGLLLAMEIDFE